MSAERNRRELVPSTALSLHAACATPTAIDWLSPSGSLPTATGEPRRLEFLLFRRGGGSAAAIGVSLGAAELRPTADGPADPKDTDTWSVAFAPARSTRVAVAGMLVGAGAGEQAAAPIARRVRQAAL